MPVLDRIAERLATDPKFTKAEDFALALECLAFCMVHMQDHQYLPKMVYLTDDQYLSYVALYGVPDAKPTFFGIPVVPSKAA
jgi:hypothetical protein